MTPAERRYDTELIASMRRMAQQLEPRLGVVATVLTQAADRLQALSDALAAAAAPPPASG
jgi:hypothetical protein